jgi:hypothetical protein
MNAITTDTVREWWGRMDPDKATARADAYALLRTILEAARKDDPPLIDVNPWRLREAGAPAAAPPPDPAGDAGGAGEDRREHAAPAAGRGAAFRPGRAPLG